MLIIFNGLLKENRSNNCEGKLHEVRALACVLRVPAGAAFREDLYSQHSQQRGFSLLYGKGHCAVEFAVNEKYSLDV